MIPCAAAAAATVLAGVRRRRLARDAAAAAAPQPAAAPGQALSFHDAWQRASQQAASPQRRRSGRAAPQRLPMPSELPVFTQWEIPDVVHAANELHRSFCLIEGIDYVPFDASAREQVATCWAPIAAADAAAHTIAFRAHSEGQEGEAAGPYAVTEEAYVEALRLLVSGDSLSTENLFYAVNCAHLAYRAGLPFRELYNAPYGGLTSARNKPFSLLTSLDKEKAWAQVSRAAQLILDHANRQREKKTKKMSRSQSLAVIEAAGVAAVGVFLGGSCNPTTWRFDAAIPMLEEAGVTYYNPQVDEWSPDLLAVEAAVKETALVLLFVIDGLTRALASMIEVSEYLSNGREVVLVVKDVQPDQPISGEPVDAGELKDLNRARDYLRDVARRHGVAVYKTVEDGVRAAIRAASGGGAGGRRRASSLFDSAGEQS